MQIIAKGAEATLTRIDNTVVKERVAKTYRLAVLDNKLRQSRTRRETKILEKLSILGIPAPKLLKSDDKTMHITMEHIQGKLLKDVLHEQSEKFGHEIGCIIGKLHANNIIHGDLTTSNMIMADKITLIDFGLSFVSLKQEDKAVDLHLLRQALQSKHHDIHEQCFTAVLKGYQETNPDAQNVIQRLEKVEKRGRNKK